MPEVLVAIDRPFPGLRTFESNRIAAVFGRRFSLPGSCGSVHAGHLCRRRDWSRSSACVV